MPVSLVQNFYKQTITTPWTTGVGNFYVSQKPNVSSGFLVISPNSESLREIVQFTAVGTDGGGDYVTVSARGLGGTTEQAHGAGEKVFMNITAQHIEQIKQAIEDINNAGALNASPTTKGVARLTASPNVVLGTCTITIATPAVVTEVAHGLTENDEIQFTTTGALPTGITPATRYFVIGTGLTADTFQFSATFGGPAVNTSGSQSGVHTLTRTTPRAVSENDSRILTAAILAALAGGGNFGTPSGANKFITEAYNASLSGLPVVRNLTAASASIGSSTTQFNITNTAGNTWRYTWNTVGTDPGISAVTMPVGSLVDIRAQNFVAGNQGVFLVTASGSGFFEVTNAAGVAGINQAIGTGYITISGTTFWTKPTGLKYIVVEGVAAGGGGGNGAAGVGGSGGGAGGYFKKIIDAASLSATVPYIIAPTSSAQVAGRGTFWGVVASATGGGNGAAGNSAPGQGGNATGGDINIGGGSGGAADSAIEHGGDGGNSFFGGGGRAGYNGSAIPGGDGAANTGAGGGGGGEGGGGVGAGGRIIVTEYFS